MNTMHLSELNTSDVMPSKRFEYKFNEVELDFPTNTLLSCGTEQVESVYRHYVLEIQGVAGYANVYIYSAVEDRMTIGFQCDIIESDGRSHKIFDEAVKDFVYSCLKF